MGEIFYVQAAIPFHPQPKLCLDIPDAFTVEANDLSYISCCIGQGLDAECKVEDEDIHLAIPVCKLHPPCQHACEGVYTLHSERDGLQGFFTISASVIMSLIWELRMSGKSHI